MSAGTASTAGADPVPAVSERLAANARLASSCGWSAVLPDSRPETRKRDDRQGRESGAPDRQRPGARAARRLVTDHGRAVVCPLCVRRAAVATHAAPAAAQHKPAAQHPRPRRPRPALPAEPWRPAVDPRSLDRRMLPAAVRAGTGTAGGSGGQHRVGQPVVRPSLRLQGHRRRRAIAGERPARAAQSARQQRPGRCRRSRRRRSRRCRLLRGHRGIRTWVTSQRRGAK